MLQIDTKIFWWVKSSIPQVPNIASLQYLYNISKKKLEMKLTLWMQINITSRFCTCWSQDFGHQSFLQVDRHDHENVKGMVMGTIKHYQSTQSNNFVMSLQYLWKEVMNGVDFGVHQDQNFYKLDYQFLLKVARHAQSTQKRNLVKFLQFITTAFVFYHDAKHSWYFTGFQSCLLLHVFGWL